MGIVIGLRLTKEDRKMFWETVRLLRDNIDQMKMDDRQKHQHSIEKHEEAIAFLIEEFTKKE